VVTKPEENVSNKVLDVNRLRQSVIIMMLWITQFVDVELITADTTTQSDQRSTSADESILSKRAFSYVETHPKRQYSLVL
jgi:hypothetical protein